ncbi:protein FAM162A-like [Lathamus discolor]|uniref:protein FAM162A-like n=1 Tax=Lathamus discolor TaxID=678569 RepID=UPI0032B824C4
MGGAVELLGRNIPSILRMTKGMDPNISRKLCIKHHEEGEHQPKNSSTLKVPGHKPTDWDKRFLLWAGHFKKTEDIPETAVKRHEILTSINLEKKAQWREEATQSTSAKP